MYNYKTKKRIKKEIIKITLLSFLGVLLATYLGAQYLWEMDAFGSFLMVIPIFQVLSGLLIMVGAYVGIFANEFVYSRFIPIYQGVLMSIGMFVVAGVVFVFFQEKVYEKALVSIVIFVIMDFVQRLLIREYKNNADKKKTAIIIFSSNVICFSVLNITLLSCFGKEVMIFGILVDVFMLTEWMENLRLSNRVRRVVSILYIFMLCVIVYMGHIFQVDANYYFNKEEYLHNTLTIISALIILCVLKSISHLLYVNLANNYVLSEVTNDDILSFPATFQWVEPDDWDFFVSLELKGYQLGHFEMAQIITVDDLILDDEEYLVLVHQLEAVLVVKVVDDEEGYYEMVTDKEKAKQIIEMADKDRLYVML